MHVWGVCFAGIAVVARPLLLLAYGISCFCVPAVGHVPTVEGVPALAGVPATNPKSLHLSAWFLKSLLISVLF